MKILQFDLTNWVPSSYSGWEAIKMQKGPSSFNREVCCIKLTEIFVLRCLHFGKGEVHLSIHGVHMCQGVLHPQHILSPQAQSLQTAIDSCLMSVRSYDARSIFCPLALPHCPVSSLHSSLSWSPFSNYPFFGSLLSPCFSSVPRGRRHSYPCLFPYLISYNHTLLRQEEVLVQLTLDKASEAWRA